MWLRQYKKAKGVVIKCLVNAVEEKKFYALQRGEIEKIKINLGLNSSNFIITMIGNLSENKGQKIFIQMAKRLLETLSSVSFLIIGEDRNPDKQYEKELKSYVESLRISENIKFIDFVYDVFEYLAISDVIVLPSAKEGLPLVILEAMACTKTVVATNVNGIPEAIIREKTGILVDSRDADVFAKEVLRIFLNGNLRFRIGREARKYVEEKFNIKRYIKELEQIYWEVLYCEKNS